MPADGASWKGQDLRQAMRFAQRANDAARPIGPGREDHEGSRLSWRNAALALWWCLTGSAPVPVSTPKRPSLDFPILPRPSMTPLKRPSSQALVSLIGLVQRHNARPLSELMENRWVAAQPGEGFVLTDSGTYALGRGVVEAPDPFLVRVFGDAEQARDAREQYRRLLGFSRLAPLTTTQR